MKNGKTNESAWRRTIYLRGNQFARSGDSVIDLRKRLNLPEYEITDETRIIIIAYRDIEVGWIVDEANDVITVHESEIESAPESIQKDTDVSIKQIVKQENRLLNIIDANAVLDKESSQSAVPDQA